MCAILHSQELLEETNNLMYFPIGDEWFVSISLWDELLFRSQFGMSCYFGLTLG